MPLTLGSGPFSFHVSVSQMIAALQAGNSPGLYPGYEITLALDPAVPPDPRLWLPNGQLQMSLVGFGLNTLYPGQRMKLDLTPLDQGICG